MWGRRPCSDKTPDLVWPGPPARVRQPPLLTDNRRFGFIRHGRLDPPDRRGTIPTRHDVDPDGAAI